MNSLPHSLPSEDRQEYERILDEALRSAPHRPELAAVGKRLTAEQLRTMALNAIAPITAAATTEYQYYVKVREEMRQPASSHTSPAHGPAASGSPRSAATGRRAPADLGSGLGAAAPGGGQPAGRRIGAGVAARRWARMSYGRRLLAAVLGLHVRPEVPAGEAVGARTLSQRTAEAGGSSDFPSVAVPVAVLAAAVTMIFFLAGLILKLFSTGPESARSMIVAGWASGSVLAGTIVVLAATALRIRSPLNDGPNREMDDRVARARDAWHEALLERGILPFLREALGEPGTAALHRAGPAAPSSSRMPHLGYSRPGFTSPDGGPNAGPRPSFSRPDYTSPDLGEPEHQPE